MTTTVIENMQGGLTTNNPRDVKDNQFVTLKNMTWDKSKRLRTRYGYTTFADSIGSNPVTSLYYYERSDTNAPELLATSGSGLYWYNNSTDAFTSVINYLTPYDNVTVLHDCENTSPSWVGSGDAANVETVTTDPKRGAYHLQFDIGDPSGPTYPTGTTATLTSTITSVDLTDYLNTGKLRLWFKPVNTTYFTSIELRWGSDSSNYYSKTATLDVTGTISNFYRFFEFDWASATTTGSPDVTAITYLAIVITHTATGVAVIENVRIDQIAVYPTDSVATNYRTRMDFAFYNNAIALANGIDPYMIYSVPSGSGAGTITIEGGVHGRYVQHLRTRMFITGDDFARNKLAYTGATPTALNASYFTNTLLVGPNTFGGINALFELGPSLLVGRDRDSYNVDVTNGTSNPIDASNGVFSDRAIANVGNSVMYQSQEGLEFLSSRDGVSSTDGIDTLPISSDIQGYMRQITPRQRNANCGISVKDTQSYLYCFDSNDDNIPDTTLVWNTNVGAFSEYTLPSAYQYSQYKDINGVTRYLLASAASGQVYEIETGFDDNGAAIECDIKSKAFDFGKPEMTKDFKMLYLTGLKSEGDSIQMQVIIDGNIEIEDTISDTNLDLSSTPITIGSSPLGQESIGGGGASDDEIDLYPYSKAIPIFIGGRTIQIRLYNTALRLIWSFERATFDYDNTSFDLFPFEISS